MTTQEALQKIEELKKFVQDQGQVNMLEKIKTSQDACDHLGWDLNNLPLNETELTAIVKCLNPPGWKADYSNSKQKKWFCVFEYRAGSGFVFACSITIYFFTHTGGGPRFALESEALANHLGRNFKPEWDRWFNA